jgi:hypothetical protein
MALESVYLLPVRAFLRPVAWLVALASEARLSEPEGYAEPATEEPERAGLAVAAI